jgi:hypothetical protein
MVKDTDQNHNTHVGNLGGEKRGKVSYLVQVGGPGIDLV